MATSTTTQKPGWQPSIRGLVPRPVSDAFEYVRNTLTSFRTQQQSLNGTFLNNEGSVGVGTGSSASVTAPALGSGQGPASPHSIVGWKKLTDNGGNTYYMPLFQ